MIRIDAFAHFTPSPVFDRFAAAAPELPAWSAFRELPALWDLPARLELLDGFPDMQQILCLGNPPIDLLGPPSGTADLARFANEELARTCHEHRERFPAFIAALPLGDVAAAVTEFEHALSLGARGAQVYTNVNGEPLSDARFRPIFESALAHDVPLFIHPIRDSRFADYATESASEAEIWFTLGWPYETAACLTRLIYSGLLEDLPGLKVVTHHMGGLIPYVEGKLELGFEQIFRGEHRRNPVAEAAGLTRPVVDYYRMVFADTALNGATGALRCGYQFFGAQHCLFATDAPFSPRQGASIIERTLRSLDELELEPAAYEAVVAGNVRRLLGIP